jgi:hypothetical protein
MQAKADRTLASVDVPAPRGSKRRPRAQDCQGPDLLRQPWAGRADHVARTAARRLSRRAGCSIARSDRRGARGARRYLRGSRRGTAGDLDRPATRRASWTAYTHSSGWRPDIAMQSADTHDEARAAWAKGHRTFRVITGLADLDHANEILCPASKEAGARTTCAACRLCGGTSTKSPKSIAIPMH